MFRFVPYILKTLWRHRVRTLLTVSGSAVALFVFCFVAAVQEGMEDIQHRQDSARSLVVFQANKFCPATSHLPQDYQRRIARMSGVQGVVPIQVFTNNCRASLDVAVFYGLPAEKLQTAREFELTAGHWSEFEQYQDAALVGRTIAARKNLSVGSKFKLGGITVNVTGIYASENPAEENHIYTHLEFLQRGAGSNRVGTVTQFEVLLDAAADAEALCREIDASFHSGPIETNTRPKGAFQASTLGDLAELIEMAGYLGYACLGLVLTLVATTTIMSVQDRMKEHAILQTIGFSGPRVFGLVLAESILLSLAGGLVGIAAALATLQLSGLAVGAEGVIIAFRPSASLALMGILVSAIAGALAGIAPAWQASRTEIVPALRQA